MQVRRMTYGEAASVFIDSIEQIKGAKKFYWIIFLITLMFGIGAAFPQWIDKLSPVLACVITMISTFFAAYIWGGALYISEKWHLKKEKDFDDIFILLFEKKRFMSYLVIAISMGVVATINFLFSPKSGAKDQLALEITIGVVAFVINRLIYFTAGRVVLDGLPLKQALSDSVRGLFKNIDTICLYGIVTSALLIAVSVVTLGIFLIYSLPILIYVEYVLFRRIFRADQIEESQNHPS